MMVAQQMVVMYQAQVSMDEIGRRFGKSPYIVRNLLVTMGQEIRKRSRACSKDTRPKCHWCEAILEEVPPGHNGFRGWCVDEGLA